MKLSAENTPAGLVTVIYGRTKPLWAGGAGNTKTGRDAILTTRRQIIVFNRNFTEVCT